MHFVIFTHEVLHMECQPGTDITLRHAKTNVVLIHLIQQHQSWYQYLIDDNISHTHRFTLFFPQSKPAIHFSSYVTAQPIKNSSRVPRYQILKKISGFCDFLFKSLPTIGEDLGVVRSPFLTAKEGVGVVGGNSLGKEGRVVVKKWFLGPLRR